MLKRVEIYTDPKDPLCSEAQSFLEEQEVLLQVHDVKQQPLSSRQISRLIRHFDLRHFLNETSQVYKKNKLDKSLPGREEVIELMATDNDLLRKPIIVAGRLMTVGCNRDKIIEMLQLKVNGDEPGNKSNSGRETKAHRERRTTIKEKDN
jgi:arsenate reductase-like glutaredoxin family protein